MNSATKGICSNCELSLKAKCPKEIPIPVKRDKDCIWCEGWCCSYVCLMDFLRNQRNKGRMEYNYSLNIVWGLMPFLITNATF